MTNITDAAMLIIVDVQKEFINEYTGQILEKIEKLLKEHEFGNIVATVFRNNISSPVYNALGWNGCMGASEESLCPVVRGNAEHIFVKDTYGIDLGTLFAYIDKSHSGTYCIYIVGIDTDTCVLKTVMDLFDYGAKPVVIKDCCASSVGKDMHEAAIKILEHNIGKENVINSDEICNAALFDRPEP